MEMIAGMVQEGTPVITVLNKSDLVNDSWPVEGTDVIKTSALTGQGIEDLKKILLKYAGWENSDSVILARERHINCLKEVLAHLGKAEKFIKSSESSVELFAEELKIASDKLSEIVGKTTSEDLLDRIFSGFCIGK